MHRHFIDKVCRKHLTAIASTDTWKQPVCTTAGIDPRIAPYLHRPDLLSGVKTAISWAQGCSADPHQPRSLVHLMSNVGILVEVKDNLHKYNRYKRRKTFNWRCSFSVWREASSNSVRVTMLQSASLPLRGRLWKCRAYSSSRDW